MKVKLSVYGFAIVAASYMNIVQATELQQGVVVDESSATVFLMQPQGGIAAIDIESGQSRWTSSVADLPLSIQNGRLLAQAQPNQTGIIPLSFLDLQSGVLTDSTEIAVDENVFASINDGIALQFNLLNAGTNALTWNFKQSTARGAAPDLSNFLDSNDSPTLSAAPNSVNTFGSISINTTQLSSSSTQDQELEPLLANLSTQQLSNVEGRQFLSANGQHILVSQRNDLTDINARFRWSLFSLSGDLLGSFTTITAYSGFVVVDNHVIFSTPVTGSFALRAGTLSSNSSNSDAPGNPLSVRAVNLENSQEVWRVSLRDTRYLGPLPQ